MYSTPRKYPLVICFIIDLPETVLVFLFPDFIQALKLSEMTRRSVYLFTLLIKRVSHLDGNLPNTIMSFLHNYVLRHLGNRGRINEEVLSQSGLTYPFVIRVVDKYRLPDDFGDQNQCCFELLRTIYSQVHKFRSVLSRLTDYLISLLQIEGYPLLTHVVLEIILDWSKRDTEELPISSEEYLSLIHSMSLISHLPPTLSNQYSLSLYASIMNNVILFVASLIIDLFKAWDSES